MKFTDIVEFSGKTCSNFDGKKNYISTGCVHDNHICKDEIATVEYINKPSRANLVVEPGDILFAKMQATKKTLLINEDLSQNIYSTGFYAVKPKDGLITKKCLFYLINSSLFLGEKDKNCSGATQKAINNQGLSNIELNIPEFSVQKLLTQKLDVLSKAIEAKQSQIRFFDNLIKARFVEMFENDNMNEKTIEDVASFCSRGKSPKYVTKSKLKVINQACIYWDRFKFENVKYNEEDYDGDRIISNNDLLICSTGTGTLGRCNIFRAPDDSRYMADSHVTIIRLNGHILPEVFKAWFERPRTQEKLYSDCVSGSTNQIELSKEKLKNMNILVPPINLQKQFASFAKQVDKSKFVLSNELTMCDFYIRLIHDRVMHSRINLRVAQ